MTDNVFSLKNRNIIITGASSGIGRQCAISFSKMGANLVLLARREEKLKEIISLLKEGKHLYYATDITDFEMLEPLISDAVEKSGKISGYNLKINTYPLITKKLSPLSFFFRRHP